MPARAPSGWRSSISNSGWKSDGYGHEWLTTAFAPSTQPDSPSSRMLLFVGGHCSHITVNVTVSCMQNEIDLLVLSPHTSDLLQPLHGGVFALLKRALACETDATRRHDTGRISRVQWVEMYMCASESVFMSHNILSNWRSTGLSPLSPKTVLRRTPARPGPSPSHPHTPLQQIDLDISLLDSSPPDGFRLRQETSLLNSAINACEGLPSPDKRFTRRMSRALETTQNENVTLRRQLKEAEALLRTRKFRKKGNRVAVKDKFVFNTQGVVKIVEEAKAGTVAKKNRKRLRKRKSAQKTR